MCWYVFGHFVMLFAVPTLSIHNQISSIILNINFIKFLFNNKQRTKTNKKMQKNKYLGGNCGHPCSNIYDIPIWMVVAQWLRYEIITANCLRCAISFLIVPHILVGMGCAFPSRRARRFATWIHRSFYDQRMGHVCRRLLGHLHCQSRCIHDNSVVGLNYTILFLCVCCSLNSASVDF